MSTQTSKQDELYKHLLYISSLFKKAGISHQISDGTLLGAVRENDILATEERDFDIDVADSEVPKIHGIVEEARKDGYEIVDRTPGTIEFDIGYNFDDMKQERSSSGGAGFLILYAGEFVGDVYVYTVFNDGLARRYCLQSEALVNAKMTIPAWFLEGSKSVRLRDKSFPGSREPEKLLAKTYGDDWQTPIAPGEFGPGRHPDSGGIYDSDLEHLTIVALGNGWEPEYSKRPSWHRRIDKIGSYAGRRWVMRHDPYFMIEDRSLFTQEESRILESRASNNPSEMVRILMLNVICARANMVRQDAVIELKSVRKKLEAEAKKEKQSSIKAAKELEESIRRKTEDYELKLMQLEIAHKQKLESVVLARQAAEKKHRSLIERRSVKLALKISGQLYRIRRLLTGRK